LPSPPYDTDYLLVKEKRLEEAIQSLRKRDMKHTKFGVRGGFETRPTEFGAKEEGSELRMGGQPVAPLILNFIQEHRYGICCR